MPKSAAKTDNKKSLLRALPSVDALLRSETGQALRTAIGAEQLTLLSLQVTDELRAEILSGLLKTEAGNAATELAGEAEKRLATRHQQQRGRGVRRVINATGVILHTNLGRAPLSEAARRAIEEASGYCNQEFDLSSGSRGRRQARDRSADAAPVRGRDRPALPACHAAPDLCRADVLPQQSIAGRERTG